MKLLFLVFVLSSAVFAQSTINDQYPEDDRLRTVVGYGDVQIGFGQQVTRAYQLRAMQLAERDAMEQCGCGTRATLECIVRVSPFDSNGPRVDHRRFQTWVSASAKFQCL